MANIQTTLYVAVDPGKNGAIAVRLGEESYSLRVKNGQLPPEIQQWADQGLKLRLIVERAMGCAPAQRHAFKATQAAARMLRDAIKGMFPRRHKTVEVNPRTWQSKLGVTPVGSPKGTPYDVYAKRYLGASETASHDECAALCIMHYAITHKVWDRPRKVVK